MDNEQLATIIYDLSEKMDLLIESIDKLTEKLTDCEDKLTTTGWKIDSLEETIRDQ